MLGFFADLAIALLFAAWLATIATVSIQNIDLVALRFLGLSSIQLPFGVMLAMSASLGAIASTLALRAIVPRR